MVELLFSSSLIALVGAGEQPDTSPRRLTLINSATNCTVAHLPFPSSVLAVHLNATRLVVVLEGRAFVYDLLSLELLDTVLTPTNTTGLAALTPAAHAGADNLLALPASAAEGHIAVHDCKQPRAVCEIRAHNLPLVRRLPPQPPE